MKTQELIKLLKKNNCYILRNGSRHDIWYSELKRSILMAKYVYPAIFTPEKDGSFSILFPDLEGCYTCGDNLEDGLEMAADVLALVLYGYEKEQRPIPAPSERGTLKTEQNEFVNYVACDTMAYRKKFSNKAVKKTLTLPEWMNDEAISLGLNFSQILQEALLQKFHI